MAKWKDDEFHVSSATVGGGLQGKFNLKDGGGVFTQDLTSYVRDAELERHRQDQVGKTKDGYRKFATIPDAVALKIKDVYGLDLHDPLFMHDVEKVNRLKAIIASDFSKLVINS